MGFNPLRDLKNAYKFVGGQAVGTVTTILSDPVTAARAAMGDPAALVKVVGGAIQNNPTLRDEHKETAAAAIHAVQTIAPVVSALSAERDLKAAWQTYLDKRDTAAKFGTFGGTPTSHQQAYITSYGSVGAKAPSSEAVAAAFAMRAAGLPYATPGLESLSSLQTGPATSPPAQPISPPPVIQSPPGPKPVDTKLDTSTLLLIGAGIYLATSAA